jgi:hypothetical protein
MISWGEVAMQDAQKREASRSRVSSKMGSLHIAEFASVTQGVANQVDWRATVVADPVWEAKQLPGDIGVGENTSLAKRER